EDVAVGNRGHPVDGFWRDVDRLARLHLTLDERVPFLDLEQHASRPEENRFVLLIVVLQAERVPRIDVYQLADVPLRLRPVQLVAPRLLHLRSVGHYRSLS